ncbi:hypothetical protein SMSP2_02467 [Limihaloglobus sulfuriphilus]|uniref:Uncharacterized protein n=1 Tax=Limihaloglobus sulfuriphilus TaxID=1851148 RepID=A0A1Q2MIG1_9BACT|nr:hypothetical protein [Limihaloglobus sulfuriphilus]AQQ72087.1 hypothetical protein SMSP2_02467 [Limihaloglobus sulfuriphilus]
MNTFSKDIDIARIEPGLFLEPAFIIYRIFEAAGVSITSGVLTSEGAAFTTCGIEPGCMLMVDDASIVTLYEIAEIISDEQLAVSIINPPGADAVSPPDKTAVAVSVVSFKPLAAETHNHISRLFGLAPGSPESLSSTDNIADIEPLRQVSVFGVCRRAFEILATSAAAQSPIDADLVEHLKDKAAAYQRRYYRSMESVWFTVNIAGSAAATRTIRGGLTNAVRN